MTWSDFFQYGSMIIVAWVVTMVVVFVTVAAVVAVYKQIKKDQ